MCPELIIKQAVTVGFRISKTNDAFEKEHEPVLFVSFRFRCETVNF